MQFKLHTLETAPEESKKVLEKVHKKYGRIPNLLAVLAESPQTLNAYLALSDLFENTSFNNEELTIVWQTINIENKCHYCVPAHTAIAHSMKVSQELIDALRNKENMPTEKYQVLYNTVLSVVRNHGFLTDSEKANFFSVGYSEKQLLEIVLGMSQKVISNYTNHIAETPIDDVFKKFI